MRDIDEGRVADWGERLGSHWHRKGEVRLRKTYFWLPSLSRVACSVLTSLFERPSLVCECSCQDLSSNRTNGMAIACGAST